MNNPYELINDDQYELRFTVSSPDGDSYTSAIKYPTKEEADANREDMLRNPLHWGELFGHEYACFDSCVVKA